VITFTAYTVNVNIGEWKKTGTGESFLKGLFEVTLEIINWPS